MSAPGFTPRPTAAVHGSNGWPLDRDDLASHLWATLLAAGGHYDGRSVPQSRVAVLSIPEARAVAMLLDEYAALHVDEPIGEFARDLAVQLTLRTEAS